MQVKTKHYLISGRVQGVSYRASTEQQAHQLGLTGWVRNLTDGRVELKACGSEVQLQALEQWLWQGPSRAQVSDVVVSEVTAVPDDDFAVAATATTAERL
ncbi:acylphosphatase [Gilvimarinus agarilyticus]|uniref:acylphosphatase n=1 Tax=Gilvimarinus agarilyticus TaxID=679259 RepID=UPI0005A0BE14|nr:acylphosphatase [Gilvimarinus agarilyticus]